MNTVRKILNVALKSVAYLLVAFTVFMTVFTVVTVTTVDRNDRSIFGVKFYIVQTDSMSKSDLNADLDVHFNAGDIVIIANVADSRALDKLKMLVLMSYMAPCNFQILCARFSGRHHHLIPVRPCTSAA